MVFPNGKGAIAITDQSTILSLSDSFGLPERECTLSGSNESIMLVVEMLME